MIPGMSRTCRSAGSWPDAGTVDFWVSRIFSPSIIALRATSKASSLEALAVCVTDSIRAVAGALCSHGSISIWRS